MLTSKTLKPTFKGDLKEKKKDWIVKDNKEKERKEPIRNKIPKNGEKEINKGIETNEKEKERHGKKKWNIKENILKRWKEKSLKQKRKENETEKKRKRWKE